METLEDNKQYGNNKSSILFFLNRRFILPEECKKITQGDRRVAKLLNFKMSYPTIWHILCDYFDEYGMDYENREEILRLSELYDR